MSLSSKNIKNSCTKVVYMIMYTSKYIKCTQYSIDSGYKGTKYDHRTQNLKKLVSKVVRYFMYQDHDHK